MAGKKKPLAKNNKPYKFDDPVKLDKRINEFFEWCKKENKVPTVTGLAYFLDTDRLTLLRYSDCLNDERYSGLDESVKARLVNSINKAKQRIESEYEQCLFDKGKTVGAIFTLKNNYKWVDKQEQEVTQKTITVELEDE